MINKRSFKVPIIIVRFSYSLNFTRRFSKRFLISNFKNIRPVGAEFFRSDRRMD